ncbi:MspA family porin [Nocardia sienata]|uniref:MspA family porin n=1 Tax=Nocardia sienata TaxID=248552 RepID=UPI001471625A|nr:MspA family porin [Nocardia sienata]
MATLAAVISAVTGAVSTVDTAAWAAPGQIDSGGLRVVASANSSTSEPSGDTAMGVPFAHAVKVSGDFSVAAEVGSPLRAGEIVAGYLLGCAVDIANGISVAIAPSVAVATEVAPEVGVDLGVDLGLGAVAPPSDEQDPEADEQQMIDPNLDVVAPPEVGVSAGVGAALAQAFGIEKGLAGELAVNLAPGTVTTAVIGAAELDEESTFPYTFAHSNTPLQVNGCLSPASAMPFVTVRADTAGGSVQTTGYGTSFTF